MAEPPGAFFGVVSGPPTGVGAGGPVVADPLAKLDALTARIEVLEASRPVRHYAGAGAIPVAAIGAAFTVRIADIVPAVKGDALKPGQRVEVWPTAAVPAGIVWGRPSVAADGAVLVPCTAGLAIATGATAVSFGLVAFP